MAILMAGQFRARFEYKPEAGVIVGKLDRKRKGSVDKRTGYTKINIDGTSYLAHRLAWLYMTGKFPEHEIDFKNNNQSDLRWDNLREATRQQNKMNSKLSKNSTTGIKGLSLDKRGFYVARVSINRVPTQKIFKLDEKEQAIQWLKETRARLHEGFNNDGTNNIKVESKDKKGYYFEANSRWLKDSDKPINLQLDPVVMVEPVKVMTKFEYGLSLLRELAESHN
jgi:hypothetical protein